MKSISIVVALLCLFAVVVRSEDTKDRSVYGSSAAAPVPIPFPSGGYASGAAISALPCPKNYLFSCQPSLQPAPCAQAVASYGGGQGLASFGGAGAYSENYPVYALQVPQYVKGYQTY